MGGAAGAGAGQGHLRGGMRLKPQSRALTRLAGTPFGVWGGTRKPLGSLLRVASAMIGAAAPAGSVKTRCSGARVGKLGPAKLLARCRGSPVIGGVTADLSPPLQSKVGMS